MNSKIKNYQEKSHDLEWDSVLEFGKQFSESETYQLGEMIQYNGQTYVAVKNCKGPFSKKNWSLFEENHCSVWEEFDLLGA